MKIQDSYQIMFTPNDSGYKRAETPKFLSEHNLQYPIGDEMIGTQIGSFSGSDGKTYKVYEYTKCEGSSICVAQSDGIYRYAVFTSRYSTNRSDLQILDILLKYGIEDHNDINKIVIDGNIITDSSNIIEFWEIISNASVIGQSRPGSNNREYQRLECTLVTTTSECVKFVYYPELEVISIGVTYYRIEKYRNVLAGANSYFKMSAGLTCGHFFFFTQKDKIRCSALYTNSHPPQTFVIIHLESMTNANNRGVNHLE